MPEMDDLELIKVLTFEWPDIKVIAMSGLLDIWVRQLTEMYGVDALLEKPSSLEEMLNVVQLSVGTEACKRADRIKASWFKELRVVRAARLPSSLGLCRANVQASEGGSPENRILMARARSQVERISGS